MVGNSDYSLVLSHSSLFGLKRKLGLSTELMVWIGRRAGVGGLALEASAFQFLCGGQFALSTLLINQIFVYHSPTDAAPQFL